MNDVAAAETKLEDSGLGPFAAPPEPRFLYTEPHLSSVEGLAPIRGRTILVSNRSGELMPPGAPNVGLFREETRHLRGTSEEKRTILHTSRVDNKRMQISTMRYLAAGHGSSVAVIVSCSKRAS